jgi:hypothetical protein
LTCYSHIRNHDTVLGTSREQAYLSVWCTSYSSLGKLVGVLCICQIFPDWGFVLWIVIFQLYFVLLKRFSGECGWKVLWWILFLSLCMFTCCFEWGWKLSYGEERLWTDCVWEWVLNGMLGDFRGWKQYSVWRTLYSE